MAGQITEFFGYRAEDRSNVAANAARERHCPFLGRTCTKQLGHTQDENSEVVIAGACAVRQKSSATSIICCPIRLYADHYALLREIANRAFENGNAYKMYQGSEAIGHALTEGGAISVYGHDWGGELRLPKKTEGMGNYFIDWVLARLGASGELAEFTAIEVQTVDTTGNYRESRAALLRDRSLEWSELGLNWENVNKRILPQLIYKGQVLQRERLCKSGLWFVTPSPVYSKIEARLGGDGSIAFGYPSQPGAIHFLRYDYDEESPREDGKIRPLKVIAEGCTTVDMVSAAFNHVVLPKPGVYEKSLNQALYGDS